MRNRAERVPSEERNSADQEVEMSESGSRAGVSRKKANMNLNAREKESDSKKWFHDKYNFDEEYDRESPRGRSGHHSGTNRSHGNRRYSDRW